MQLGEHAVVVTPILPWRQSATRQNDRRRPPACWNGAPPDRVARRFLLGAMNALVLRQVTHEKIEALMEREAQLEKR